MPTNLGATQHKDRACLKRKLTDQKPMSKGSRRNTNEETNVSLKNELQAISILELQDEDIQDLPDKEFKNHDKGLHR